MSPNDFSSSPARLGSVDIGLRNHMQRIYNRMTLGVLITAVISFYVGHSPALLHAIYGIAVAMGRNACSSWHRLVRV